MKTMVWYLNIFLSIFVLLRHSVQAKSNDDFFLYQIKKGESISLICIDIYGYYHPHMAKNISLLNPQINNINVIIAGKKIKLPKVKTETNTELAKTKTDTSTTKENVQVSDEIFTKKMEITQGVVTHIEGKAFLTTKGATQKSPLTVNTMVHPGDMIQTGAKSRVEIIINRESVTRMDENSQLILEKYREIETPKGKTSVKLIYGKLWIKVKKITQKLNRFELNLPNAIAGVYGTVYETDILPDKSTEVKVFTGAVIVKNKPGGSLKSPSGDPGEIPGPSEIPGPHEVTMEEWTRIVRSMQKVKVSKDGTPSKVSPFKRDPQDNWEKWNYERDQRITELFMEI